MAELIFVFGTRPEVIKLSPLILEARRRGHAARVILTGQHRDLALPLLRYFGIEATMDLDVMSSNQSLSGLSQRILSGMDALPFHPGSPGGRYLVVQGDTTSAFAASYWALCNRVPVAHVEAGLRTYDLDSPFPEEANRQLIGRIARLHFAPTLQAARNLKAEQIFSHRIHLVGNTAIDALKYVVEKERLLERDALFHPEVPTEIGQFVGDRMMVLVTAHRRESFGPGFERICEGIRRVADSSSDVRIVYPVHPNPNVRSTVRRMLGTHPRILLCDPLPFVGFTALMSRANALLTDSGGVQEEGPTLRKPIIVMRDKTERPEGVQAGFAVLVGTDPALIERETVRALRDGLRTENENPYGDGKAAPRIMDALEREAEVRSPLDRTPELRAAV